MAHNTNLTKAGEERNLYGLEDDDKLTPNLLGIMLRAGQLSFKISFRGRKVCYRSKLKTSKSQFDSKVRKQYLYYVKIREN